MRRASDQRTPELVSSTAIPAAVSCLRIWSAVARAIVTRPAVVLADEPTGNLDSRSEADVLDLLAEVHAQGATIVMVTHSREVAERGTRIVHMLDGLIDLDEALAVAP